MGSDETVKDGKGLAKMIGGELLKWLFLASFFLVLILIDLIANQWNWF